MTIGHLKSQLKGYIFRIYQSKSNIKPLDFEGIAQENNHYALPQCCPNCNTNFSRRKYIKSPIRSYRTGIAKSNQILLKSFFHQLDHENRKLISFSDSREDAAQFAYKTEQEHHRNTISDILMDIIYEESTVKNQKIDEYKGVIEQFEQTQIIPKNKEFISLTKSEIEELKNWLRKKKSDDSEDYEIASAIAFLMKKKNQKITAIALSDLFPSKNTTGTLTKKLLEKGMNPNGVGKNKDFIDGKHWDTYFDLVRPDFNEEIDSVKDFEIKQLITSNLKADVCDNLFSKLWFSFENAGIGIVKLLPDSELWNKFSGNINKNKIQEYIKLTNAFIRVLGENYRYVNPDSPFEVKEIYDGKFSGKIRLWKEIAEQKYPQFNIIMNLVNKYHYGFVIDPANLYFEPIQNSEEADFYECNKCNQTHLHTAGNICTFVIIVVQMTIHFIQ